MKLRITLIIVAVMSLLVIFPIISTANDMDESCFDKLTTDNDIKHSGIFSAFEIRQIILNSFPREDEKIIYPDYFSGIMLNGYGQLVIFITPSYSCFENTLSMAYFHGVTVKFVEFSFNELYFTFNSITELVINLFYDNPRNIIFRSDFSWSICREKNRVVVLFDDCYNAAFIDSFKNYVLYLPLITFVCSKNHAAGCFA